MGNGKRSKAHRRNKGIEEAIRLCGSQECLATLLKRTQASVSYYLIGKVLPSISIALRLEKLGVPRALTRPDLFKNVEG